MNTVSINGVTYTSKTGDVSVTRDVITINGEEIHATGIVEIRVLEGAINNLTSSASVNCTTVNGDIKASGSVRSDDVGGNVKAGGSVRCDNVGGSVKAGGSVRHS